MLTAFTGFGGGSGGFCIDAVHFSFCPAPRCFPSVLDEWVSQYFIVFLFAAIHVVSHTLLVEHRAMGLYDEIRDWETVMMVNSVPGTCNYTGDKRFPVENSSSSPGFHSVVPLCCLYD